MMSPGNPALQLLLVSALVLFWLMPLSAWLMLSGRRNLNANIWFAGTACYALAALVFVLRESVPGGFILTSVLSTATVLLLLESLRRETDASPAPWKPGLGLLLAEAAVLGLLEHRGTAPSVGLALHLLLLTVLDMLLLGRLLRLRRAHASRALWIVIAAFAAAVLSNGSRLIFQALTGQPVPLLGFSTLSNAAFIVNFVGVIFYSFGYWGFVYEKEYADRRRAREAETRSQEREKALAALLQERDILISQLSRMQRVAQAGALSASIAHEINQPLGALRLNLEEAQVQAEALSSGAAVARMRVLVQRALEQTLRAARIVSTLREVFRARETALEPRRVDAVVDGLRDVLRRRAQEVGVNLVFDVDAPVKVSIGDGELEHVVLNLVTNAMDAAPHGAGGQPTVHVQARVADGRLTLAISDNGPGIPAGQIDSLFELLRSTKSEGMGLGLWLSRHIVERHGGRLRLADAGPPGACFTVELPIRAP
jgi:signal transduction histidine kinase